MVVLFSSFIVKQKGLLLYQRKQLHPFASGVVGSLIKRKDLLEWEANIEESNVKDNELLLSCPFGFHFTLWLFVRRHGSCSNPSGNTFLFDKSDAISKSIGFEGMPYGFYSLRFKICNTQTYESR